MQYGTVPSGTYDLLKQARIFAQMPEFHPAIGEFEIQGKNKVVPLRKPDCEVFSESDIECLMASIKEYGHLSFSELHKRSMDKAFQSADPNGIIDIEQIIGMLPNGKALLQDIRDSCAL